MKIEKLTENKIRVIMNFKDIENNTNDLHSFFNNMANSQNIFLDILEKAEKEVNFHTEGCKLLIEAFSSSDDIGRREYKTLILLPLFTRQHTSPCSTAWFTPLH